jgi:hypothetical protein
LQARQNVFEGLEVCITTHTCRLGYFLICRIVVRVFNMLQSAMLPTPHCCLVVASCNLGEDGCDFQRERERERERQRQRDTESAADKTRGGVVC